MANPKENTRTTMLYFYSANFSSLPLGEGLGVRA